MGVDTKALLSQLEIDTHRDLLPRQLFEDVIAVVETAQALDAHIMQRADWPLAKWLIKLGEFTGSVQIALSAFPQQSHIHTGTRAWCPSCKPAAGAGQ